jgi:outer membrane protein assembly factor BamE (lipoprotein component of BamABCDE complex)
MKVQNAIQVIAVVAVFACASCASIMGNQFDTTHKKDIRNGVQDKNQIREWFGNPNQVQSISSNPSGCAERWTYVYTFWSWVETKKKTGTLLVYFGGDGKVCDQEYLEQ